MYATYAGVWPLEIYLKDNTGTVFSDDTIPATLDLAGFVVRRATLDTLAHFVSANLESVSWTVPEPSTLAMIALGMLGVAAASRGVAD